jgi:hypothetical protein
MAEQAQVVTPAEQEAPTDEQRVAAYLERFDAESGDANLTVSGKSEAPPAEEVAEQPKTDQAPELTPDDLPEVEAATDEQPAVDEFEIVHEGKQHKLTRAKTIELAQQGFDYTQKTMAVAEAARQVQERLARVQAMEQIQPLLAQDAAQVSALEGQLKQYQNVDWVTLATNDPIDYSRHRAQYDVLANSYQQAVGRRDQKVQAITQEQQRLTLQQLEQEKQKLFERIPEWKDPAKYQQGTAELRTYLLNEGAPQERIDSMRDSLEVTIVRKAMLYDKLVKAKTEKVKQLRTAPPVTRPGSATSSSMAKADKTTEAMQKLRKTGDQQDAVEALLNRWK